MDLWVTLLLPWLLVMLHHTHAQCPAPCTCSADMTSVTCDNADLGETPGNLSVGLIQLSLRHNNITSLGEVFLQYPNLNTLDLAGNPLANVSGLGYSSDLLERLVLQGCNLEDEQLAPLSDLHGLQELDLGGNQITELGFLTAGNLTVLRVLDLSWNRVADLPDDLLPSLPNLTSLNLQGNQLATLAWNISSSSHRLRRLDLSHNRLESLAADSLAILSSLERLDVSHNSLASMNVNLLGGLGQLFSIQLGANPLAHIPNKVFANCTNLKYLQATGMPKLTNIPPMAFLGLGSLVMLNLSNNAHLEYIHPAAFSPLESLETLDLSGNGLQTLYPGTFRNLTGLRWAGLGGNPWQCDCDAQWLHGWVEEASGRGVLDNPRDVQCSLPAPLIGTPLLNTSAADFPCEGAVIMNHSAVVWHQIGDQAVLDCVVGGAPSPAVTWITPREAVYKHHSAGVDRSLAGPGEAEYHRKHHWHDHQAYIHQPAYTDRITTLPNGSLYIDYVTRADAGPYTCIAENSLGNNTVVVNFKLKYLIKVTVVESIIVGFGSALSFFLVTAVIAAIRYVTFWCSKEERNKRKSIKEVLETIQDYKSAQFDKLKDYKQAKVEQISAYKSAKLGQLSAFKTAKIDKIRTYKQMTVTNIILHMQKMREHYTGQVGKIKDNCSKQVEKLQENYCNQMGKFKDYKSHQVDRIRENYQGQVMKIREYGSDQLKRLRDQYKMQQQHIMKLLELLDIGNCMHVIEAECIRTESMIFDPNITLDLEAKPVHICLTNNDESGNSDYLTASSDDHDDGSVASMPFVFSIESETGLPTIPLTVDALTLDPLGAVSLDEGEYVPLPTCSTARDVPNVSARGPMLPLTPAHLSKSSHHKSNTSANCSKPAKHHRKHRARGAGTRAAWCHAREGSDASGDSEDGEYIPTGRRPPRGSTQSKSRGREGTSTRPTDLLPRETGAVVVREVTPGPESSNNETEYESARESRDQTPEYANTPRVCVDQTGETTPRHRARLDLSGTDCMAAEGKHSCHNEESESIV